MSERSERIAGASASEPGGDGVRGRSPRASGVRRFAAAALAAAALLGACSGDDDEGPVVDETGTSSTTTSTTEATTTTEGGEQPSTTSTTEAAPEADPLEAAQTFMDVVFPGNTAVIGEFAQGDAQSGEVPVLRPNEGGGAANLASTLLLRLDGTEWQVIGAVNEFVTIEAPENGAEVPLGPLTVSGAGRGFEATLVARALDLEGGEVASAVGTGGAQAEPVPYEVTLDLAPAGGSAELVVVVAGGTGLEGDPGEFSAVRVTVSG